MPRAAGLLLVALFTFVGGCGPADVHIGGVRRTRPIRSIVSLSPSTTELLSTTQEVNQGRLTGRTAADNYPKGVYEKVPIVATVKPDYEKITALKPDLIAYDADLYGPEDVAKLKALGADMFVLDATTVEGLIKELYGLASIVGGETYISDYVDKIHAAEADAAGMSSHPTVAVILPGPDGSDRIAGVGSFDADVVKQAGGSPVGPAGPLFIPLDPEKLLTWNPDWIVTSGDPTSLLADPRFKSLKAISQKQVIPVSPDVLLRRGARVDALITAIHDKLATGSK